MGVHRVPFVDALEDVTGGNAKLQTGSYQSVGQFPIVDQGQEFISGYSDDEELLCHRDGDVIVFGDHTKVFKYIDFDFILGADGVKVLRPKSGFDARYLYHFLQTVRLPENLGYSRHFKYLKECLVPKPAFEEQQRIAAILDKADSLRRKRQQAICLADDFLRAVFLDMFGDPVTNPKGWPVRKLGDLARNGKYAIKAGPFGSALKKEFYASSGYRIYGQEQVIRDDLSYGDYYIDGEKYRELESCKVEAGDILISLVGTFGKICIVPPKFEPGIINPRLMKISLDPMKTNPVFVKALLTSESMKGKIESLSHGGTMGIVNVGIMKGLDIPVPPLALQERFQQLQQKAFSSRNLLVEQANEARSLRDSLTYSLIN